ncbi:hypothetical protein [Mastigocladopsis repens]|uniref:hypothetical protein n=1 Tax=Mastigocladopsis repens TaxID=221287 RepID=UPI000377C3AB|nr:hypothetical protein [Mastigocladopsis repens]
MQQGFPPQATGVRVSRLEGSGVRPQDGTRSSAGDGRRVSRLVVDAQRLPAGCGLALGLGGDPRNALTHQQLTKERTSERRTQ